MALEVEFKATDADRTAGIVGIHPLALMFPPLTCQEYDALFEDIHRHGLRYPILLDPAGLILDGVHRRRAALECGLPLKVAALPEGTDPAEMVLSLNLMRRSLTGAQRAMVGVSLYYERKDGPGRGKINLSQAAMVVGVSTAYLEMAKRVYDHEKTLLSRGLTTQVLGGLPLREAVAQVQRAERAAAAKPAPVDPEQAEAKRAADQRRREIDERVEAARVAPDPTRRTAQPEPEPEPEAGLNLIIMSTDETVGYDSSSEIDTLDVVEPYDPPRRSRDPEPLPSEPEPDPRMTLPQPPPFDFEEWKLMTYRCPDMEQHAAMVPVFKATETRIKERQYKAELARRGLAPRL